MDYTPGWYTTNPGNSEPTPTWRLQPSNVNLQILGIGPTPSASPGRNVTFSFNQIVSYTPAGKTNLTVSFHGFPYNETALYDDATFNVTISKQLATKGAKSC